MKTNPIEVDAMRSVPGARGVEAELW